MVLEVALWYKKDGFKELDLSENQKLLILKLKLVQEGSRDISLAMDSGLYYMVAVELHLLLKGLEKK